MAEDPYAKYFQEERARVLEKIRPGSSVGQRKAKDAKEKEKQKEAPSLRISCSGEAMPLDEAEVEALKKNYKPFDPVDLNELMITHLRRVRGSALPLGSESLFYAEVVTDRSESGDAQYRYSTLANEDKDGEEGNAKRKILEEMRAEMKKIRAQKSAGQQKAADVIEIVDFTHVLGTPKLRVAAICGTKASDKKTPGIYFIGISPSQMNEFYYVNSLRLEKKRRVTSTGQSRLSYTWTFCLKDFRLERRGEEPIKFVFRKKADRQNFVYLNSTSDFDEIAPVVPIKSDLASLKAREKVHYQMIKDLQLQVLQLKTESLKLQQENWKRSGIQGTTNEIVGCYLFDGHDPETGEDDKEKFAACVEEALKYDYIINHIKNLQKKRKAKGLTGTPIDRFDLNGLGPKDVVTKVEAELAPSALIP